MYKYLLLLLLLSVFVTHAKPLNSAAEHADRISVLLKERQNKGAVDFKSVGSVDAGCDFASIQEAIDSGVEEVRISAEPSNSYYENIVINNQSVALKGGYATCQDANQDNKTDIEIAIDGSDLASVVTITGDGQRHIVTIQNLILTNGKDYEFLGTHYEGGGVSIEEADLFLVIDHVYINGNKGFYGGGISVDGSNTVDIYIVDSIISFNESHYGGGISCLWNNSGSILIDGATSIYNNSAGSDGGAIYLAGCGLTIFSEQQQEVNLYSEISSNRADHNGGAIWGHLATVNLSGAQYCNENYCFGSDDYPIKIYNNESDADGNMDGGYGGGIYVSNGTTVNANNLLMQKNRARYGGAVAIYHTAQAGAFNAASSFAQPCWSPGRCNQFIGNEAFFGGAFYLDNGGEMSIGTSLIQGNRATTGTVGYIKDDEDKGTKLDIEGSIIVENGDSGNGDFNDYYAFKVDDTDPKEPDDPDAQLILSFVTLADNKTDLGLVSNSGGVAVITSSIVMKENNQDPIYNGTQDDVSLFNCLLTSDPESLVNGVEVMTGDPKFVDAANDDYRIQADSDAVDFCDAFTFNNFPDIDGEARGWDEPNIQDHIGVYDVGADEYRIDDDLIFADDFDN